MRGRSAGPERSCQGGRKAKSRRKGDERMAALIEDPGAPATGWEWDGETHHGLGPPDPDESDVIGPFVLGPEEEEVVVTTRAHAGREMARFLAEPGWRRVRDRPPRRISWRPPKLTVTTAQAPRRPAGARPRERRAPTRARARSPGDPDREPDPPLARQCAHCHAPLNGRRPQTRTCSTACRVALHRAVDHARPRPDDDALLDQAALALDAIRRGADPALTLSVVLWPPETVEEAERLLGVARRYSDVDGNLRVLAKAAA